MKEDCEKTEMIDKLSVVMGGGIQLELVNGLLRLPRMEDLRFLLEIHCVVRDDDEKDAE